jgi:hypothetical protein
MGPALPPARYGRQQAKLLQYACAIRPETHPRARFTQLVGLLKNSYSKPCLTQSHARGYAADAGPNDCYGFIRHYS